MTESATTGVGWTGQRMSVLTQKALDKLDGLIDQFKEASGI